MLIFLSHKSCYMQEIFRFQQLRTTQKLSEEQKLLVGLPLYPEQSLSDLANDLIKCESSSSYLSLIERYKEKNKADILIHESQIHPTIRMLYDWLNFKARPIK